MNSAARSGFVAEIFTSFQGEGARVGERHLFVRLAGCNIRCRYCDTPDSLERTPRCRVDRGAGGEEWLDNPLASDTLRQLIEAEIAREATIDAVSITGGEPLVQASFLAEVLGGSPLSVPVLLETNGMLPKQLALVLDRIDVVSMDVKPPSNTAERAFWEEHEAFLRLASSREVYVKVLVDSGTDPTEVERAAALLAAAAPHALLFLQPVSRAGGGVDITAPELENFHRLARARVGGVRVLPQTHKMLGIQ
jgi:organic radical activating enzyme